MTQIFEKITPDSTKIFFFEVAKKMCLSYFEGVGLSRKYLK